LHRAPLPGALGPQPPARPTPGTPPPPLPSPRRLAKEQQAGRHARRGAAERLRTSPLALLPQPTPVAPSTLQRNGKWDVVPGEALLPGDIISIGRPTGEGAEEKVVPAGGGRCGGGLVAVRLLRRVSRGGFHSEGGVPT
jgi:hypothetical protein